MLLNIRQSTIKWYTDCHDAIKAKYKENTNLFIDILAATSPRKQVTANWRLAERIFKAVTNGQPIPLGGVLPAHKNNILRAIKGEPLSGPKVSAFAANLKGQLNEVTIDIWVDRFYPHKTHKQITKWIKRGAKRLGIKPAEYQAIVWTKARIRAGKQPMSFTFLPEVYQMLFEF